MLSSVFSQTVCLIMVEIFLFHYLTLRVNLQLLQSCNLISFHSEKNICAVFSTKVGINTSLFPAYLAYRALDMH